MAVSSTKSQDHQVEISIIRYFRKLKDPRRQERCLHELQESGMLTI
jgi:hypothetical protein